jgi:hypothetical protein
MYIGLLVGTSIVCMSRQQQYNEPFWLVRQHGQEQLQAGQAGVVRKLLGALLPFNCTAASSRAGSVRIVCVSLYVYMCPARATKASPRL